MPIEITQPETEALIVQYLQTGGFHNVDELVALFAESPFRDMNIEFESEEGKDFGRDVTV